VADRRTVPTTTPRAKSKDIPDEHKQILLTDIKCNRARDAVRASPAYLDYIDADFEPAERLVASGIPAWVVHAEKGDGGLTDAERATLDAAPLVTVVTIPAAVFFLPDEAPRRIAEVTAAALNQASRSCARTTEAGPKPPAHAASPVRGLLGWICWGDDVDGDLAESQVDTWSGLHA
jgi:hypothetical protein